ncbi:MAG: ABC transporter ATP-binding protein [Bacilli bacterium]|nr:ABC transporter ATP-binding protein [Bacilli bacterium]
MKKIKFILHYTKPQGHKLPLILISVTLYSFGLLLIPLIISFVLDNVINGMEVTNPLMLFLFNLFGGVEVFKQNFWLGSLLVIFIYLMIAIGVYLKGVYSGVVSETFTKNLRDELYDHLQKLPFSYHKMKDSGDLIQRSTSDIDQIRRFLAGQIAEMMFSITTALIAITILVSINLKLTLISFVSLPILIFSSYFFFKKSKHIFLECDLAESKLTTTLQENLSGVRVVKAFNKENAEIAKFEAVNNEYKDKIYDLMHALAKFWSSTDLIVLMQVFATLAFGIVEVYDGNITTGEFVIFVTYISSVLWPLRQLGRIIADMGKLSVAVDRISEVINEDMETLEAGKEMNIEGNIVFDNVSFRYENSNINILDHISFAIKAKQKVAIMGPTGSGKSSLVNLLTRLYEYEGSIKIDGVELNTISKQCIRKNVNIVLQEPFLFSKTIYDNISLSKKDAGHQDVVHAAQIAHIHDVIESFDEGYETEVGEKGVTLSGGQKQRIAIARTIINDSSIVIFDDSLSALDTKTDTMIQEELAKMNKQITMLMITHRVSSAMDADMIIVLDHGKIAQIGTHDKLCKQEGIYKKINDIQNEGGVSK